MCSSKSPSNHSTSNPNKDADWHCLYRVLAIRALLARAAEVCFLLQELMAHGLEGMVANMDSSWQQRISKLRLRDWVCSVEGEAAAAYLISVLVTVHMSSNEGAPHLILPGPSPSIGAI